MDTEKIEKLFNTFEKSISILQEELNIEYLDALVETGDNLYTGEVQVIDNQPSDETVKALKKLYAKVKLSEYKSAEIREAIQLVLIRATQEEKIQANHQFTPDAIGMVFNALIDGLDLDLQGRKLADLSVGTGNLIETVLDHLASKKVSGIGIDNDDTMLSVASMSASLEGVKLDLIHQDSIEEIEIEKVPLIVSDLPVGYYPIDEKAKNFATHDKKEHSFVHHLLIEQSMNVLEDSGIGIFLVPSNLFQTNQGQHLLSYFHDAVYLQAMLNLPLKMFKEQSARKSILILQKVGGSAKQANPVLLGDLPEFNQRKEMQDFLRDYRAWAHQNIYR